MIKKLIALAILCCSLLFFALFSSLFFLDYNLIAQNLIVQLKLNPQNIGKITIHKFPLPYINVDFVEEIGKMEVERAQIHFSPWSLLTFKPEISKLKILNAKIYSEHDDVDITNHEQLIVSYIINHINNIHLEITTLNIYNKNTLQQMVFHNCSLYSASPFSSDTSFRAYSEDIGQISGLFEWKEDAVNFHLNIENDNYDFKLSEIYKDLHLISGTGEYEVKNPAAFMYNILPDLSGIFRNFDQHRTINAKFDIAPEKDLLKFDNIVINSADILGNGTIHVGLNAVVPSTVQLSFSKIDINALTDISNANKFNTKSNGLRFVFADKMVSLDISIEQMILHNNDTLNKVIFSANLASGVLVLDKFSGMIGTTGKFELLGNITQNSVRSLFEGRIFVQHNNLNNVLDILGYEQVTVDTILPFTMSADLKLTLIDLYLQNFMLNIEGVRVTGDIAAKFIGSLPHINSKLDISSLNLDQQRYPVISPVVDFVMKLMQDMRAADYFNKFIPIRTLRYLANLDLNLHNITIFDTLFDQISLLLHIVPTNLYSSNFNIKKGGDVLSTSWKLDAEDIKPSLKILVKNGILNVNDAITPKALLSLQNMLSNEFDMEKLVLRISGYFDKITQSNLVLDNTKFFLENDGSLFKIHDLETEIFSGKFKATGNILLDHNTIDFVYAFNLIDLTKLSPLLPPIFPNLSGGASINGKFSTNGDTIERQLYNLKTQSQFLVSNTQVNHLSIDSLIENLNSPNYDVINFDRDLKYALSSGHTDVSNINGNIEIQNGIMTLKDSSFETRYSAGALVMALNMYDFNIQLNSMLSFYIRNTTANTKTPNNTLLVHIPISAQGSLFNMQKTADSMEIKKVLQVLFPTVMSPAGSVDQSAWQSPSQTGQ